ncbi:MAG TPA: phosphoadenylyl-sulfate reductase [Dehalococcoidia bacterium]|nr:phosphoadenylyl-sulfate reductase [Dehalococcoidia bacterium]
MPEAPDPTTIKRWNEDLEGKEPQEILKWTVKQFQPGLTVACSFGGPTGMVLLDMVMKIDRTVEVFYLDTDFLFPETYALRDACEAKYGFKPIGYKSLLTPEAQAEQHGEALWLRDPDLCCDLRKVEPNKRALDDKKAWISGMRRDQSKTRADIGIVEWDAKFNLIKLNPLATWTEQQVWAYIMANDVPYNQLHNKGYPSIGCTNCTKPVREGDDPRSGRWAGQDKEECGIQEGSITILQHEGKISTFSI